MDQRNTEAGSDDRFIPLWMKATVTIFAFSGVAIFILSLLSEHRTLFGLTAGLITGVSFGFVLFSLTIVTALWAYPQGAIALFFYWLIRFFRAQICTFALLGILYLVTIRTPLFSFRGGIPLLNLILLFLTGVFLPSIGLNVVPLPWMRRFFDFFGKAAGKIDSMPTWILRVIVAFLPILIICFILYRGLGASPLDYRPYSLWNDETGYWLWVRSFSHVGLDAGYNVPNELTAPAAFSRYGEGSPFYTYIYGSIAWLLGWSPPVPILINFIILALAIFLFTHFAKFGPVQIVFVGLIAVLIWPILIYLPLTTHETLNQALGFILAAIFLILLISRQRVKPLTKVFFVFLVYFATLVRLSWGIMLIPVIFYSLNGNMFRRALFAVLLGLGLYISTILITGYLVPPVNNSIFLTLKDSLTRGPQILVQGVYDQFFRMFRYRQLNASIAVMFQILVIVGWSATRLTRLIKSGQPVASILQSQPVFNIYSMVTLVSAGLLFYIQEGFDRIFAPSILIICLLQVARKDYKFLLTLLAINIVFFYSYIAPETAMPQIITADYTTEFSEGVSLQSKFEKWMAFDPATPNPWCNTLLIPIDYYDLRLTTVPPGMGVSYVLDSTIETPLKSKYLLFDQATYNWLADRLNVRLLESTKLGDLYYNLDSGCAATP